MFLKIVQTLIVIGFFYFVLKFSFLMLFCTTNTWEKMKKDQIKKEHEEDIEKAFKDLPDIVINIRHEKDDSETGNEKYGGTRKSSYR